ncbi:hypothetical protein AXG93_4888s1140 [Marchantia polymorpha subsp. ruderalis]|uniref:Xyloglucan endotransglucosylase/hydrolase n=2 Tax=Marchantia polymorpha TaxID=3197 RepID=A0A176VKL0_MARPO|nr:hypothetical protein AXG93_4888s1140 [Marchantia polymorpha subsp. ruderalis]
MYRLKSVIVGRSVLSACLIFLTLMGSCFAGDFHDDFTVVWSRENVIVDDASRTVKLSMNEVAGASLASSDAFLFGSFSVKLKLIKGDSAGTVCSFYLTSYGSNHDEIDFEFLGNETGQPYVVHTNLFSNGVGGREQRMFLWFDPTESFHTYSVIWNHHQILWTVDDTPIRLHRNMESVDSGSYPHKQPMVVAASIFDASTWATRGGAVPTKWEHSPFVVDYKDFTFQGCKSSDNAMSTCTSNYQSNWWETPQFQTLDTNMTSQLRTIHHNYMVYDYCLDQRRYPIPPKECSYNQV